MTTTPPLSNKKRKTKIMVVFPKLVFKLLEWILYQLLANSIYKAAKKMNLILKNQSPKTPTSPFLLYPNISKCSLKNRRSHTLVCDIDGSLLKSSHSFFPYFMLVSFEGGSILRAFLLLVSWPILCFLNHETKLKAMIFISFFGLPIKDMENVCFSVFPKFYLENLNLDAFEALESVGFKVVFSSIPKVMIEGFLRDYLHVNDVVATDLKTYGRYYTGFVSEKGLIFKHKAMKQYFGEKEMPDIAIGTSNNLNDHLFISLCKEAYVVNNMENQKTVPRERYPKPLIFHDGRLAFLPTPASTLCMFMFIPIGVILAIFRISIGIVFPYKIALMLACGSGLDITLSGQNNIHPSTTQHKGVLFVCTHRTLLDPVFLSNSLAKPLIAVTYSLSKFSEIIAPLKTVRLTRDRIKDGETMKRMLSEGDLVVCPEGTTCREPYLLRFSPLFAELTDDIVPVAINTRVSMFYGTTASGLKWLDAIFFLMNPRPSYEMIVLPKLPYDLTCGGGGKSSCDVANCIQRQLADVLGFECTKFTRKDKYLMLAGNEGLVGQESKERKKIM